MSVECKRESKVNQTKKKEKEKWNKKDGSEIK